MACNIGKTATGPFLFIGAANQGGANDSENYIVLDSKGGPMIWKIHWSWEAGGSPLWNILFSCKAVGGSWAEKYIVAEEQGGGEGGSDQASQQHPETWDICKGTVVPHRANPQ